MRYFMVQATVRTTYGTAKTKPRIVAARDPIEAAKACVDDHFSGKVFVKFKVWKQRTPEDFLESIGALKLDEDFDEDTVAPAESIEDMFESTSVEVRL